MIRSFSKQTGEGWAELGCCGKQGPQQGLRQGGASCNFWTPLDRRYSFQSRPRSGSGVRAVRAAICWCVAPTLFGTQHPSLCSWDPHALLAEFSVTGTALRTQLDDCNQCQHWKPVYPHPPDAFHKSEVVCCICRLYCLSGTPRFGLQCCQQDQLLQGPYRVTERCSLCLQTFYATVARQGVTTALTRHRTQ